MANPFLPKLKEESPQSPQRRYDPELVAILEHFLAEQELDGLSSFYASFHKYLFAVVAEAMPQIENRRRAVEYLQGRVEWQLKLRDRRPPRGWRKSRIVTSHFNAEVYDCLNEIGGRIVDFWSLLVLMVDGQECTDAQQLLFGMRSYGDLTQALQRIRIGLIPKARSRLSALAA
jgi:hypothetical protein